MSNKQLPKVLFGTVEGVLEGEGRGDETILYSSMAHLPLSINKKEKVVTYVIAEVATVETVIRKLDTKKKKSRRKR